MTVSMGVASNEKTARRRLLLLRPIGALSFVLHPQAFDRPANLFRNYQTLYQGVIAQK